jgi:hypothetical protein
MKVRFTVFLAEKISPGIQREAIEGTEEQVTEHNRTSTAPPDLLEGEAIRDKRCNAMPGTQSPAHIPV